MFFSSCFFVSYSLWSIKRLCFFFAETLFSFNLIYSNFPTLHIVKESKKLNERVSKANFFLYYKIIIALNERVSKANFLLYYKIIIALFQKSIKTTKNCCLSYKTTRPCKGKMWPWWTFYIFRIYIWYFVKLLNVSWEDCSTLLMKLLVKQLINFNKIN